MSRKVLEKKELVVGRVYVDEWAKKPSERYAFIVRQGGFIQVHRFEKRKDAEAARREMASQK